LSTFAIFFSETAVFLSFILEYHGTILYFLQTYSTNNGRPRPASPGIFAGCPFRLGVALPLDLRALERQPRRANAVGLLRGSRSSAQLATAVLQASCPLAFGTAMESPPRSSVRRTHCDAAAPTQFRLRVSSSSAESRRCPARWRRSTVVPTARGRFQRSTAVAVGPVQHGFRRL
jgi:hypothetical protein